MCNWLHATKFLHAHNDLKCEILSGLIFFAQNVGLQMVYFFLQLRPLGDGKYFTLSPYYGKNYLQTGDKFLFEISRMQRIYFDG